MFVTCPPRAQATWPFAMYFSVTAINSAAIAVQNSIEDSYTETQQQILNPEPQNPHTACKGKSFQHCITLVSQLNDTYKWNKLNDLSFEHPTLCEPEVKIPNVMHSFQATSMQ